MNSCLVQNQIRTGTWKIIKMWQPSRQLRSLIEIDPSTDLAVSQAHIKAVEEAVLNRDSLP